MGRLKKMEGRLRGLHNAITRYPLTAVFLFATALMIAVSIQTEKGYPKEILTFVVGAVLSAVLQAGYERFFDKFSARILLMIGSGALTLGYYLIIRPAPELSLEIGIRTSAALLALFAAFIWVPVIHSRISFNESFMAAFKAFFHSLLYAGVLFGGCSLIITAVDTLIFSVDETAYPHTANIVFVLFASLFFLSLIPVYPGVKDKKGELNEISTQDEFINKAALCPKFLEVLISYIIIPLTAVFTFILLLYIVRNVRGAFWTNNLLEPLLVSYAITVILVYILSSRLENQFAVLFRRIFPKILVPIVLFQIASSILSLRENGMTHIRYFVILFGIFAASAGVVMSIAPVRKNGILAAMLIVFSIVSIIPPIDAFTVSRLSQESMLKNILIKNEMLEDNTIIPNALLSNEDKKKIASSVEYLDIMGYTDKIEWLPKDFTIYEDFYDTFGFYEYDMDKNINRSINVFKNSEVPIDVAGYDVLSHTFVNSEENREPKICEIEKAGKRYTLTKEKKGEQFDIILRESKREIIRFNTQEVFSRYGSYAVDKSELSNKEATFSVENEAVKISFIVQEASINLSFNQTNYFADFYILIRFK